MSRVRIEFERGGSFVARLFEDEAPKTCEAIRKHLPFTYRFQQSIVSGHAIVALPPDLTCEEENQRTVGIPPGSLCFLVKDPPRNVPDEIYISYGPYFVSRCSYIDFQQPVNVFGLIDASDDELMAIGQRILLEGAEQVTFSPVNEQTHLPGLASASQVLCARNNDEKPVCSRPVWEPGSEIRKCVQSLNSWLALRRER